MRAGAKLAIVHHHLRTGGVSRVISRTVRALGDRFALAVLAGEAAPRGFAHDCAVGRVEGLGYAEGGTAPDARDLAKRLRETARDALGGAPDIWHVHNHSLGKNPALGEALALMANQGEHLLLHIHDFAEDGRPSNYRKLLAHCGNDAARLAAMLYPVASHVHYATINSRDRDALTRAGIPPAQIHLVHNPVEIEGTNLKREGGLPARHANQECTPPTANDSTRLFLYPSRAIRRKNIGEFLLWSAMAAPGDRFAVTMAPQNPAQRPAYDGWVQFAATHELPVDFDVGGGSRSLADLLGAVAAAITTSVAEGFGLAFLEPALAGRPVVGRNLPEVTAGIAELGIDLSGLYSRLDVPLEWIGAERLRDLIEGSLTKSRELFGRKTSRSDVDAALAAACHNESVDFGRLDEAMQQSVIGRAIDSPDARAAITPHDLGPSPDWRTAAAMNREVIARELSPEAYATRLGRAYTSLLDSPTSPQEALNPDAVLEQFLDAGRFLPLMT